MHRRSNSTNSWDLKNFTSFVVFGDSYTDENRLGYFASHNGSAPPVGWVEPEVSHKRDRPVQLPKVDMDGRALMRQMGAVSGLDT